MIRIDTYWYSSKRALSTQDARKLIFEKPVTCSHLQQLEWPQETARDRFFQNPAIQPQYTLSGWALQSWQRGCPGSFLGQHSGNPSAVGMVPTTASPVLGLIPHDSTDSEHSWPWPWSPWCFTQTNSCGKLTHSLSGMSQKVRSYDTYPNVVIIPRLLTLDCWLYLPRSCLLFISGCSKYRMFTNVYLKNHLNVEKIYHTCRLNC